MGKIKPFDIEMFFRENVHHMSGDVSCHKSPFVPARLILFPRPSLVAYHFSVSVVTQSIYKSHSIAKFQINSSRENLGCLII